MKRILIDKRYDMKPETFYTLVALIVVLIRIAVYSVIGSVIGIIIISVCKAWFGM